MVAMDKGLHLRIVSRYIYRTSLSHEKLTYELLDLAGISNGGDDKVECVVNVVMVVSNAWTTTLPLPGLNTKLSFATIAIDFAYLRSWSLTIFWGS